MTRLEDLLHSLTTILVRFHDAQPKIKIKLITDSHPLSLPKKSRQEAIRILADNEISFDTRLKEIIALCNKAYPERTSFLNFMLNEITFLKKMNDRKKSFTIIELEDYKNQLTQLFLDFRQLLLTVKDKTCEVKYSTIQNDTENTPQMSITLSGLVNNAYVGNHFCNSGILLNTEVLERFCLHIPLAPPSSNEENSAITEINLLAEEICTEHQNTLLIPELMLEKSNLEKMMHNHEMALKSQMNSLNEEFQTKTKEREFTISSLNEKVKHHEACEKKQHETIISLKEKLQLNENNNKIQNQTIVSLTETCQLAETRTKMQNGIIVSLTERCQLAEANVKKQNELLTSLTEKSQRTEISIKKQNDVIQSLTKKLEQAHTNEKNLNETINLLAEKQKHAEIQLAQMQTTLMQKEEIITQMTPKNNNPTLPIGIAYGSFFGLPHRQFNKVKEQVTEELVPPSKSCINE